jgi:hypothetical protein
MAGAGTTRHPDAVGRLKEHKQTSQGNQEDQTAECETEIKIGQGSSSDDPDLDQCKANSKVRQARNAGRAPNWFAGDGTKATIGSPDQGMRCIEYAAV